MEMNSGVFYMVLEIYFVLITLIAILLFVLKSKINRIRVLENKIVTALPESISKPLSKTSSAHTIELVDAGEHQALKDKLQSLQQSLIKRNKLVIELTEKLDQSQAGCDTANKLRSNIEDESSLIANLKGELDNAENMYQQAQTKIQQLENANNQYAILARDKNTAPQDHFDQNEIARLRDVLEDLMEKYNGAKHQLEELRLSNSEKRSIILRLASEQTKMSVDTSEEIGDIIDKLKIELRDSEMCTAVLESETESLREKVHELTEEINIIHTAGAEVETPEVKKDNKLDEFGQMLLDSLTSITGLNESEDIATQLIHLAKGINVEIFFLLRNNLTTYWGGTHEHVEEKIQKLLLGIESSGDERWIETTDGAILSLDYCRVIILGVSIENPPVDLQRLAKAFSTANAATKRIELQVKVTQQKNRLNKIINKTKSSVSAMESQHKQIIDQAKEAVKIFNAEFDQFSQSVEFSQLQSECISDIINDLSERMSALFATDFSIDKSYLELTTLLEADDAS